MLTEGASPVRVWHWGHPAGWSRLTRALLLTLAIVAATALTLAYPWMPHSPWNDSMENYGVVADSNATGDPSWPVPKIIHQTWKTDTIPEEWQGPQAACRGLHPGYDFRLWTDESARELVAKDYPELLQMYDGYPYGIQRADAMRLAIVHKFGGIYMDLDIECLRSMDFLRQYEWVMPHTAPVGFSNDFFVAAPKHPFLWQLLQALPRWNHQMGTKYPTVMFSTGPMFVSYQASHYPARQKLAVLPDCLYGKYKRCANSLFLHYKGSSWHGNDAALLKSIFRMRFRLLLVAVAGAVALYVAYRGVHKYRKPHAGGSQSLELLAKAI